MGRRAARSRPRSTSWKGSSSTSDRPAATPTWRLPASAARNIFSSAACCAVSRLASWRSHAGCTSSFPVSWHYHPLRALDHMRKAGVEPDERMAEAIEIVASKRDAEGRWPLEHAFHEELVVDLGETVGEPSRWLTLQAMRVLRWAEGARQRHQPRAPHRHDGRVHERSSRPTRPRAMTSRRSSVRAGARLICQCQRLQARAAGGFQVVSRRGTRASAARANALRPART